MLALSLVQAKEAPGVVLVKLLADTVLALHRVMLAGTLTMGVGLTVITMVCAAPVQPLAEGVMVMVPLMGKAVVLLAVKAEILPVPAVANPMAGLELDQL